MNMKIIRLLFLCIVGLATMQTSAQEDSYVGEIGISAGSSFYLGDANNQLFNNNQPALGVYFRYNFNPRLAFRTELNRTGIAGEYNNASNQLISFDNPVYTVDFCGEFNFFELGEKEYQRFSKSFSPYIFAGLGMMTDLYTNQNYPGISIPFGVGLKVILSDRWNLNAQWSNRLLLSDHMEGVEILNNPYGLNGSNVFNNDLLSTLTIGVSYNFWKKQCDCKNNTRLR